jgi:hypothetical protein
MLHVSFLADCVNVLSGSMHTIKKSTEALLATNNETVLEVNSEKTTCITMPRYQNSGFINVATLQSFYNSHNTSELYV